VGSVGERRLSTDASDDLLPRRHDELEVAEFDGEFVVFDPRCMDVHLIGNLTAVVFDACDGRSRRSDLISDLVDVVGLDGAAAERAVTDSLDALAQRGLIAGTTPERRPP
jgi:hypothetical protein